MALIVVSSMSLVTSCNSDDDGGDGNNPDGVSVSIDGNDFNADVVVSFLTNEGRVLSIIGTDSDSGQSVSIAVGNISNDAPLSEGTFDVSSETDSTSLSFNNGNGGSFSSLTNDGSINGHL